MNLADLAGMTEGWSGSDLKELCRCAAVYRVRDLIKLSDKEGFAYFTFLVFTFEILLVIDRILRFCDLLVQTLKCL